MRWPKDFLNQVVCGDCLEVMRNMPDNCVDTVITDPPYGLKFMGKDWDHGVPGVRFWAEILRVAKPGAMCLAFGGTRTYHRLVCAIEDAGWQIRDCIMWIYGSGFPKSLDISKAIDKAVAAKRECLHETSRTGRRRNPGSEKYGGGDGIPEAINYATAPATEAARLWDGWGTAFKPAHEPICVAMKPLDGTFANNALKHGVAGLNIDGGRIELAGIQQHWSKYKPSAKIGYGGAEGDRGGEAYNPQGRWPANVIHDGSDEVVRLFPCSVNGSGGIKRSMHQAEKGNTFKYSNDFETISNYGDNGSAARFFYCAKASKSERGENNNHPTVKPLALMQYLCRLTATPTGGIVLDPFLGSGTTIIAAKELRRDFIGIEIEQESCAIAETRLHGRELFAGVG